jgi:hypothetical protein
MVASRTGASDIITPHVAVLFNLATFSAALDLRPMVFPRLMLR